MLRVDSFRLPQCQPINYERRHYCNTKDTHRHYRSS